MASNGVRSDSHDGDFTTVSRIRDAAIARFARDGFRVGLRTVAADAGVTAGLVVHHFGSKDGLRRGCDEHVLAVMREEKAKALTDGTGAMLLAQMAEVEKFAPMVQYVLRSMQAGGDLALSLIDHMIADAEEYLSAGEAAGVIRPSRDRAARTRYLAYQATGSMVLWFTLHGAAATPQEFPILFRRYMEDLALPALELFTQGLLVDRSMLDEYLMYVPDPPTAGDAGNAAR
ncbi:MULTISPECIES: TetR/AcrR family transcriptional regulator [unclassified Plantactinospora]|uniref:TetR/AcrR family transcriptional regulator n=1 Tax=unclassified Plantactinospora TaxID=2631981 RepID=UPI000D1649D8|nr:MULTISPECIES: TetR family transcriptional regulator [unclassified Plantactinospora]AVT30857.1 TetR family transcriptional regulator [Plantactinospora sp. BC1]AVT40621.1 TetR family transcriptional regulator [Plantactinospora sp. BB1]